MLVTGETYNFPPYPTMVLSLFKVDLPGNQAALLHAAIGIAGEGSELKEADCRKNFIEECGDIEFYMQAAHNILEGQGQVAPSYLYLHDEPRPVINLGTWADVVQSAGGRIIDFTKKAWVYGNREPNFTGVFEVLRDLRDALDFAYEMHGTDRTQVCFHNQVKLIGSDGRYKSGKYSDEAALARNDKVASGEEVHSGTHAAGTLHLELKPTTHQPRFAAGLGSGGTDTRTEVQGSSIRAAREAQSIGKDDVGSLSAVIGQINPDNRDIL